MTIQGAIAELKELMDSKAMPFYFKPCLEKVIETLEMDLPSIDIVHCKDCKHWKHIEGSSFCGNQWETYTETTEDDYCSHGERKCKEDCTER